MSDKRIFYHANCADGMTGAWVVRQALKAKGKSLRRFYPMLYGDEIELDLVKDTDVIFVDFSPEPDVLTQILEVAKSVLILDHHKTAIKKLEKLFFDHGESPTVRFPNLQVVLDVERSGAMIAWDHYFSSNALTPHLRKAIVPNLVLYVQDRDLWKHELKNSKAVQCYIRSFKMSFEDWDALAQQLGYAGENDVGLEMAMSAGGSMLRSQDRAVETMADQHTWVTLLSPKDGKGTEGGVEECVVPVANASIYFSDVAHELTRRFNVPFAGYYFDRQDGKRQWGVTSAGDFDVSAVARLYGGGGHKGAAGFTTARSWFPDKAKDGHVIPD